MIIILYNLKINKFKQVKKIELKNSLDECMHDYTLKYYFVCLFVKIKIKHFLRCF